ncbi:uncharacterized protein [Rutidosis leptorrhynchoides]|uniref:uncharacterized protein n=1 Tax=Rutidosis leptorrhynchoides TaxID=125765 RepID=UPI003A99A881
MANCRPQLGTKRKASADGSPRMTEISFPAIQTFNASWAPIVVQEYLPESGHGVKRLHIDNGSSVDIMYDHYFRQLPTTVRRTIKPPNTALSGFSGESVWPIGILDLKLELRDSKDKLKTRTESIEFCVVRSYSRYNAILGRTSIQKFGAVPSTIHGMVRFLTDQGVATLESAPLDALCASVSDKGSATPEEKGANEWWVIVNPEYPEQKVKIGGSLTHETKEKLRNILIANSDVFCWRDADMTGVPREIAQHYHRASINLTPIKQKKRPMAPERSEWLHREVDKLVKANILRKVNYQTWVANPVLVAKSDGTWRLCIDFKYINKACPKDNYPLPEIDWNVESLAGFRFKCFLDAYKGYHQIQMAEEDEEKTAFHTDNRPRDILLHQDAFRIKERERYLQTHYLYSIR